MSAEVENTIPSLLIQVKEPRIRYSMNNNYNIFNMIQQHPTLWQSLSASMDPHIDSYQEAFAYYDALLTEWNAFASLLSEKDAAHHIQTHILDCLSLIPIITGLNPTRTHLLDIGSGGGFPAIPIKILFPSLRITLMERSQRKAGFLLKVISSLKLEQVDVLSAFYPHQLPATPPDLITARAVEKPQHLIPEILDRLSPGAVFLNQSGFELFEPDPRFHVEPIWDEWNEYGLRRGTLSLYRRTT